MYCSKTFGELLDASSSVKPFSFNCDGEKCDLSNISCTVENGENGHRKMIFDAVPGKIRVTLEMIIWQDFPVIEYTPYIENISNENSAVISDFSALDYEAEDPEIFATQMLNEKVIYGNSRISVRYNLGSKANGTDFLPQKRDIFSRHGCNKLELECSGAWCSTDFLPYFGIDSNLMNGVNIAIGWNGAWKFSVEKDITYEAQGVGRKSRIKCGMKRASFFLYPGEKVMQPGILLHFREGKTIRDGQNEFRRFMIKHHSPRNSRGELLKPAICFAVWGGLETEKQLQRIKVIEENKLPYEAFWIDAGWMGEAAPCPHFLEKSEYKSNWYQRVGSWEINTWSHPDGLRPVADAVHKAGMRLLVWFEGLRVHFKSESAVIKEHPEWLIGNWDAFNAGEDGSFLLNIGIPEARQYLFDTVCRIIEREHIDDYREDFNMEAWPFLVMNDEPGREGITEMKFSEGFFLFWESLRKQFPDMYIDNCSGGGRRLNYKTASLAFPLCQSDFAGHMPYDEECIQLENYNLDDWIPLHGTLNWGEDDPYHAFSGLGGGGYGSKIWQFSGREPRAEHDFGLHRKVLQWGILLRDMHMAGDIYPQVDGAENDFSLWNGQQIHDPAENCGMVQIFRRKASPEADFTLHLSGLTPDDKYEVEFFTGEKFSLYGKELASMVIHLENPRSFQIIRYALFSSAQTASAARSTLRESLC